MPEGFYGLVELIKKTKAGSPDYEKIKEITPKIIRDWKDVNALLYCLPEIDYDEKALEAVLLAIPGSITGGREENGLAKAVLFHLYHDGEYEILIHDRTVKINAQGLKSRESYNAFLQSDCPYHYMHVGDADIVPDVPPLDAHDYMMLYLFGTNFGYDANDYPAPCVDDPSCKSFERAIAYLPILVDCLVREAKNPVYGMERILFKMEDEGYSAEEISRLCRGWLGTVEEKGLSCLALMDVYLSGRYEYSRRIQNREIDFGDKKDFLKAKSHIPTHVSWLLEMHASSYVDNKGAYDPDIGLENRIRQMRYNGLDGGEIADFATSWMREMLSYGRLFYSLMYLHLFGENFGGVRVNIDGVRDFDAALSLIPDYLSYLFDYKGEGDEFTFKFDCDFELYKHIARMKKEGYGESEVNTFVLRWIDCALEKGNPFYGMMHVLLLGEFTFKNAGFVLKLTEDRRDFDAALSRVADWVNYLTDMCTQYHHGYGECDVLDLLVAMRENGYEMKRIERLFGKYLEQLAGLNDSVVPHVKGELCSRAEKEPWLGELLPIFE